MQITLIDGLHDSDSGGAGIIEGALTILQQTLPEGTAHNIALIYRTSGNTRQAKTADRHTRKSFPELQIYFSPYNKKRNKHRIVAFMQGAAAFGGGLWKLAIAPISRHPTVRRVRESDLIISKGGHFYHSLGVSKWSPVGLISSFVAMFLLLLSLRLKKSVVLLGHSIGPYPNIFSRWFAKRVFEKISYIGLREEISAQHLREMGVPETSIYVIPDTAFAIECVRNVNADLRETPPTRPTVGITPRPWDFPQRRGTRKSPSDLFASYISELSRAADCLIKSRDAASIFLIAHNVGYRRPNENDNLAVSATYHKMQMKNAVTLIGEDLSVKEQCALYGSCDVLIGTRMHSIIFALLGGCPTVAISYTHKTRGMMNMLGLSDYVIDIENVDAETITKKARKAIARSSTMIASFDQIRQIQLKQLREFLREAIEFQR